jgi:hypothetical protein
MDPLAQLPTPEQTPAPQLPELLRSPTMPTPGSLPVVPSMAPINVAQAAALVAAAPTVSALPLPTAPAVAANEDVIEPEWVDQAESLIAQTAGNPYAEEEAIEALQIDYLRKRYGHEVHKTGSD